MKLLFSWCHLFKDDSDCKLGLDWYTFSPVKGCRKDLEGSEGFGLTVYLVWRVWRITWVKDYAAYSRRMNYRHSDHVLSIRKKLEKK
jgi:hypothetical protein